MELRNWTVRVAMLSALSGAVILTLTAAGGGCAARSAGRGQTAGSPSAAGTEGPDGGFVTPPPAKKGIIIPGDPASGTAVIGPGSGSIGTTTGTSGSRINPGQVQTGPGAN